GGPTVRRRRAVGGARERTGDQRCWRRRDRGGRREARVQGIQPTGAHLQRDARRRRRGEPMTIQDLTDQSVLLSTLDDDQRFRRFDELQERMRPVWKAMRQDYGDETVVVIPSITIDRAVARSGSLSQAYEERFLFMLVLLRQPRLRMVYVTSMPVAEE